MPIHIRRIDDKYEAEITPPHGGGRPWRSPDPMTRDELIGALLDRGCHQTDVGDAMFESDPEWETRGDLAARPSLGRRVGRLFRKEMERPASRDPGRLGQDRLYVSWTIPEGRGRLVTFLFELVEDTRGVRTWEIEREVVFGPDGRIRSKASSERGEYPVAGRRPDPEAAIASGDMIRIDSVVFEHYWGRDRFGGPAVPEPDWPLLIAELLGVRSKIHEIDGGQLWGYALPRTAATEADILAAEQRLGRRLDAGYRRFLSFADGWAHIAQDGLVFGTQELGQGDDWAMAIEWLDAIAERPTDLPVASKSRDVLPIMLSRTTPSLAVMGGPEGDSVVRWYYEGSLADQWPTFDDYFRALIELSLDDLQAVRTDPELRELLKE